MTTSRTDKLLGILQGCFNPCEEGWLWLALFHAEQDGGLVCQFKGEYIDVAATADILAQAIDGCRADAALLALCRSEGRPTEADRRLWRELRDRLTGVAPLIDMVVFNDREAWSMHAEDRAAAR